MNNDDDIFWVDGETYALDLRVKDKDDAIRRKHQIIKALMFESEYSTAMQKINSLLSDELMLREYTEELEKEGIATLPLRSILAHFIGLRSMEQVYVSPQKEREA